MLLGDNLDHIFDHDVEERCQENYREHGLEEEV